MMRVSEDCRVGNMPAPFLLTLFTCVSRKYHMPCGCIALSYNASLQPTLHRIDCAANRCNIPHYDSGLHAAQHHCNNDGAE